MPTGYFHLFAVVLGNGTPQAVRGLYRLDQCGYTSSSCSFLWCISKHGIINQAFLRLLLRVRLPCGTGTAAGRRYHPDGGKGFWTGRPRCPLPVTGSKHLHTEGPPANGRGPVRYIIQCQGSTGRTLPPLGSSAVYSPSRLPPLRRQASASASSAVAATWIFVCRNHASGMEEMRIT